MQIDVAGKSKSLQGITDLTLTAPIKKGLIDAVDTRTYGSRLRLLLSTLSGFRASSREVVPVQFFSDTVERIKAIHSFRLAILEPEQRVVLAVTFDSAWEPYIRVIWRDLGPLLDVIFCNCEGYVTAYDHGFEQYAAWVRGAQAQTVYFYADSALTVADLQYLRKGERSSREQSGPPADLAMTRMTADDPSAVAVHTAQASEINTAKAGQQGLAAISALYRLADMYPPDGPEGDLLLRAAHALLKDLQTLNTNILYPPGSPLRALFAPQLEWFERDLAALPKATPPAKLRPNSGDLQGGILTGYRATHGALLLCSFADAAAAQAFLGPLVGCGAVTTEGARRTAGDVTVNVAFTFEGLRKIGVPATELGLLPQEFQEGMEARAGVLGDLRSNHPRNWTLPERNWGVASGRPAARVQTSMVDMVLQLSVNAPASRDDHRIADNPAHPLYAKVAELARDPAVRVLSVQALRRQVDGASLSREHFGFVDGVSQPAVGEQPTPVTGEPGTWTNAMPWGELFLGYSNASDDPVATTPLLVDGTFLVVRKLRQDVAALDEALGSASAAVGLAPDELKAKMMGRTVDGDALAASGVPLGNAFDYRADPQGAACPFQAHIRRANPRTIDNPKVPRIVRRGMTYGPPYKAGATTPEERGLVFMAYNASIAEQFEVIQRWLAGGNSTGVFSGQSDPLLGVPQDGDRRVFRFEHAGNAMRVELDVVADRPFVRLEWGMYLFVPSIPTLRRLAEAKVAPIPPVWSAALGEVYVAKLLQAKAAGAPDAELAAQWKALLEDISSRMSNTAASVWAAIRERHGGVLRTPYGVLVAGRDLARDVYLDPDGRYSVCGYAPRMQRSFGMIYLGLDQGPGYQAQSSAVNAALMTVDEADAFMLARESTLAFVNGRIAAAKQMLGPDWSATLDMKDVSDAVLATLCRKWFGMPDAKGRVDGGGWQWNWTPALPPRCPGHFAAPSRFMFQPNPGAKASKYGADHGQVLFQAFRQFVADQRQPGAPALPPLGRAIFDAFPNPQDADLLASTFIGVLMGFLPTADGNLRGALYEWINFDRRFWDLQEAYLSAAQPNFYARACAVLKEPLQRTMQLRPTPEVVWRTAVAPHKLGDVDVVPGDVVVVGIVSATQEALGADCTDVTPIFGGPPRSGTPHPTHACPGYEMGMGVILGIVAGLMEAGPVWPGPLPLTLSWKA